MLIRTGGSEFVGHYHFERNHQGLRTTTDEPRKGAAPIAGPEHNPKAVANCHLSGGMIVAIDHAQHGPCNRRMTSDPILGL